MIATDSSLSQPGNNGLTSADNTSSASADNVRPHLMNRYLNVHSTAALTAASPTRCSFRSAWRHSCLPYSERSSDIPLYARHIPDSNRVTASNDSPSATAHSTACRNLSEPSGSAHIPVLGADINGLSFSGAYPLISMRIADRG